MPWESSKNTGLSSHKRPSGCMWLNYLVFFGCFLKASNPKAVLRIIENTTQTPMAMVVGLSLGVFFIVAVEV